ncbi:unnamed protein product, partial [Ectocarpus sp. 12 AP-2014]
RNDVVCLFYPLPLASCFGNLTTRFSPVVSKQLKNETIGSIRVFRVLCGTRVRVSTQLQCISASLCGVFQSYVTVHYRGGLPWWSPTSALPWCRVTTQILPCIPVVASSRTGVTVLGGYHPNITVHYLPWWPVTTQTLP